MARTYTTYLNNHWFTGLSRIKCQAIKWDNAELSAFELSETNLIDTQILICIFVKKMFHKMSLKHIGHFQAATS